LKGALHIFFSKGQKVNKFQLLNQANRDIKDANMTEIVKNVIYAPDNFLLRGFSEDELLKKIHGILLDKLSVLDVDFDVKTYVLSTPTPYPLFFSFCGSKLKLGLTGVFTLVYRAVFLPEDKSFMLELVDFAIDAIPHDKLFSEQNSISSTSFFNRAQRI
jgi:hypothetical protein